jgi:hypothetical protein
LVNEQVAPIAQPVTVRGVLAEALGCLLAGAGSALVIGIAFAWSGIPHFTSAVAALTTWGIVTGAMTFWTFSRDPIRNAWEWEQIRIECDRLEDDIETLEDANESLGKRNAWLEAENARLTLQTKDTTNYVHHDAATDPIRRDAEALIDNWIINDKTPPTLRGMGWSSARYTTALDWLQAHGIISRHKTQVVWNVQSKAEAVERITSPAPSGLH